MVCYDYKERDRACVCADVMCVFDMFLRTQMSAARNEREILFNAPTGGVIDGLDVQLKGAHHCTLAQKLSGVEDLKRRL